MECQKCQAQIPAHVRLCVVCGVDVGCPNVRAAQDAEEVSALRERVRIQQEYAANRHLSEVLESFRLATSDARAVMCKPLGLVSHLVSSDNLMFATFYEDVAASARIPEDNDWDRSRQPADAMLFAYYFQHLGFALLSLDGSGADGYGGVCMTLRDVAIRDRATTFEENSILFVKRHSLHPGDPVPKGFRATWSARGDHAVAKLGHLVEEGMTFARFTELLRSGNSRDADFIEVNIYGPIHRRAIERAITSNPTNREDRLLWKSIQRKLLDVGATIGAN
jgi:hypothetical protein